MIVDSNIVALIAVALGGVLVLLSTALTGFLSFRLKRDSGEPFLGIRQPKGDAFVVDELLDSPAMPRTTARYDTPLQEPDFASKLIDDQTSKFLEQLTIEKAKEKAE